MREEEKGRFDEKWGEGEGREGGGREEEGSRVQEGISVLAVRMR